MSVLQAREMKFVPRVLVVEDQKKLLNSLTRGLEQEGYEVVPATTGEEGYYAATTRDIDAMDLDLMLPGRDGIQVLRDLRAHGFTRSVLILTACDSIDARVAGLDSGADDYLVKPFAFAELLARLPNPEMGGYGKTATRSTYRLKLHALPPSTHSSDSMSHQPRT